MRNLPEVTHLESGGARIRTHAQPHALLLSHVFLLPWCLTCTWAVVYYSFYDGKNLVCLYGKGREPTEQKGKD